MVHNRRTGKERKNQDWSRRFEGTRTPPRRHTVPALVLDSAWRRKTGHPQGPEGLGRPSLASRKMGIRAQESSHESTTCVALQRSTGRVVCLGASFSQIGPTRLQSRKHVASFFLFRLFACIAEQFVPLPSMTPVEWGGGGGGRVVTVSVSSKLSKLHCGL